ncbi:hypothetical protein [Paludifilum halophilum]|uniref:Lipoyl-binding domain-containing protein n=1 Tax=Paludifilum halophilum TaxID=1642702 RepID=A0A235BAP2_9BACL|nr:hypothetical protein [Paludifilum halophilum]OYD09059.1 hypothetical protein CHM34_04645 [Paludifilum halophilum]
MVIQSPIVSPCCGIIEKILCHTSVFQPKDSLFLIRTTDGELRKVTVDYSGTITSYEVRPGDEVFTGMVLAYSEEDLTAAENE